MQGIQDARYLPLVQKRGRASAQKNRVRPRMPRFCAAAYYLPDHGIHVARDIRLAPRA